MAVPCPGCGRSYDVALFQFGRTLDCACGSRVGIEPRVRRVEVGGRPRFLADAMLGRLARWLRTLGYDTAWEEHGSDEELVRQALREERILLTRDRRLEGGWRISGLVLLRANDPLGQLAELAERYDLAAGARPFSRCRVCNAPLVRADRASARARVPARVFERSERFWRCPGCERFYWEGSHVARMRRVLDTALGGPLGGEGAGQASGPVSR